MALRIDRLEQLATVLETQDNAKGLQFNMDFFRYVTSADRWDEEKRKKARGEVDDHPYCGTAGCIGGWACAIFGSGDNFTESEAIAVLSDSEPDGFYEDTPDGRLLHRLFYAQDGDNWQWVTRQAAAEAVREFIATNDVDWGKLKEKHWNGPYDDDDSDG
jgi:hypothetical protein